MNVEYKSLFSFLNKEKIIYCLLRKELDNEDIIQGDIDILFEENKSFEIIKKLESIGYLVKTSEKYLPFKTVMVKYTKEKPVVLDLHFKIIQHGFIYLSEKKVLNSRKKYKQWYIPKDGYLLLLLLVHNIIGKRTIQKKHLSVMHEIITKETSANVLDFFSHRELKNKLENILGQISNNKENILIDEFTIKLLQKDIAKKTPFRIKIRCFYATRMRELNLLPKAPLYVLLGVDGVGKTSLLKSFEQKINSTETFKAKTIYFGSWGHYLVAPLKGEPFSPNWSVSYQQWWHSMWSNNHNTVDFKSLLAMIKKNTSNEVLSKKEQQEFNKVREFSKIYLTMRFIRSTFRSYKFFFLLIFEMLYRYYKAYKYRRRGFIVIGDRYIYDLMMGGMHNVRPQYYWIRKFICKAFFKPTKVFLLTNDPDIILSRKKDLEKDQLIKFMEIYSELSKEYGFIEIPTIKQPDEMAEELLANQFSEIVRIRRG